VDRRQAPPAPWVDTRVAAKAGGGPDGQGQPFALAPDPENGKTLFGQTCTSCHGAQAQGLPHQGVDLRHSKFIAELNDSQLTGFLKVGRQPKDPKSQRGMLMPALAGIHRSSTLSSSTSLPICGRCRRRPRGLRLTPAWGWAQSPETEFGRRNEPDTEVECPARVGAGAGVGRDGGMVGAGTGDQVLGGEHRACRSRWIRR
jgi:hypothetical protein